MRFLFLAAFLASFDIAIASADRIDEMISPAFHAVTFEDPRSISEARFLFVYHELDDEFVTGGGDVQVYALQLRYALSDRLALIATKDGFVDFNPDAALPKETGIADIELGAKYAFFMDRDGGQIATAALRYLIPVGDDDVLQGEGNGELHPSLSAAFALSDQLTLMAGTGMRIAMDSDYSSFWDLDMQLDYRIDTVAGKFYPLIGASLIYVMDEGKVLPIADEGQDFFNFGASEADGESIITGVGGLRYRPIDPLDFGATFQFPFNSESGTRVIDYRWNFDVIYRF